MTDELRKSFETLLKNGDYVKAEAELIKFMKLEPEDRDAKMLYGTCRMHQGDTETASQVKESRNKPKESLFHAIVSVFSVFMFFFVFPWMILCASLWLFVPLRGSYYAWTICITCIVYTFLIIYHFRESKNGDKNEVQ